MIDHDRRTAILSLSRAGNGVRAIAKALGVSRNTVKKVLTSASAEVPPLERDSKLTPHLDRVRELHRTCRGNLVRVRELLAAEGIEVGYSTLTGFCRRHSIGVRPKKRVGQYHFEPGEEMQHDTSPHSVVIGCRRQLVQCASLVLCWSRMLYAQVFPTFDRFACRVFLTEGVRYFHGAGGRCVVDNTSVVVVRGNGADAVFAAEMVALGDRFGFDFLAHERGDANRSAHVERSFDTIERNFYPGRTFDSLDDLNRQLLEWCDQRNRLPRRHLGGAAPIELFATEQPALKPLPLHVPEIYEPHVRRVDDEGYVNLHTNRYSVPDAVLGRRLTLHETRDRVRIFDGHKLVYDHEKRPAATNQRVTIPGHHPRGSLAPQRIQPTAEEAALRAADPVLGELVDVLRRRHGGRAVRQVRELHRIFVDYPTDALVTAVRTALAYRLHDVRRIERMVLKNLAGTWFRLPVNPDSEEGNG
jgi:transposase